MTEPNIDALDPQEHLDASDLDLDFWDFFALEAHVNVVDRAEVVWDDAWRPALRGRPARERLPDGRVLTREVRPPGTPEVSRVSVDNLGYAAGQNQTSLNTLAEQTRAWRPERRHFNALAWCGRVACPRCRPKPADEPDPDCPLCDGEGVLAAGLRHADIAAVYSGGKGGLTGAQMDVRRRFRAVFADVLADERLRRMVAEWIVATGDETRVKDVFRALGRAK